MRKPPAADNDPISRIPATGYCLTTGSYLIFLFFAVGFVHSAAHYGEKSDFSDSDRRILLPTTGKNPIFLIPTVGKSFSLRVKMTELYFQPYKVTEIYGTEIEIFCFGRSETPIWSICHSSDFCRRGLRQNRKLPFYNIPVKS